MRGGSRGRTGYRSVLCGHRGGLDTIVAIKNGLTLLEAVLAEHGVLLLVIGGGPAQAADERSDATEPGHEALAHGKELLTALGTTLGSLLAPFAPASSGSLHARPQALTAAPEAKQPDGGADEEKYRQTCQRYCHANEDGPPIFWLGRLELLLLGEAAWPVWRREQRLLRVHSQRSHLASCHD